MKIFIYDSGDVSVGIQPATATFEICGESEDFDKEQREYIRKDLTQLCIENFDFNTNTRVTFEDECSDCGEIKGKICKGNCTGEY